MTESRETPSRPTSRPISRDGVLSRIARVSVRMLAAVALVGGSVAFAGIADSAPAFAADGVCDGVSVVVDLTDIGGELEVRCAAGDQATGRDALLAAGFTTTDAEGGYICAINAMPDPCPEVFDGNFWSYWNTTPNGEWTSYEVGADSSAPSPGSIEGWRYNDGATPPGIAPADVAAAMNTVTPRATQTPDSAVPGSDQSVTSTNDLSQQADNSMLLTVVTVGFLALIAVLVLFFVIRNRRKGSSNA
ncbi:MAG: hypothetical protein ABIW32_04795 [Terrimesophilobacter sp.]